MLKTAADLNQVNLVAKTKQTFAQVRAEEASSTSYKNSLHAPIYRTSIFYLCGKRRHEQFANQLELARNVPQCFSRGGTPPTGGVYQVLLHRDYRNERYGAARIALCIARTRTCNNRLHSQQ